MSKRGREAPQHTIDGMPALLPHNNSLTQTQPSRGGADNPVTALLHRPVPPVPGVNPLPLAPLPWRYHKRSTNTIFPWCCWGWGCEPDGSG